MTLDPKRYGGYRSCRPEKKVKTQSLGWSSPDKLEKLEISSVPEEIGTARILCFICNSSFSCCWNITHGNKVNCFVEHGAVTIVQRKSNVQLPTLENWIESSLELNPGKNKPIEAVVGAIGKRHPPFLLRNHRKWKTEVPADYPRCADMGKSSDCSCTEISRHLKWQTLSLVLAIKLPFSPTLACQMVKSTM